MSSQPLVTTRKNNSPLGWILDITLLILFVYWGFGNTVYALTQAIVSHLRLEAIVAFAASISLVTWFIARRGWLGFKRSQHSFSVFDIFLVVGFVLCLMGAYRDFTRQIIINLYRIRDAVYLVGIVFPSFGGIAAGIYFAYRRKWVHLDWSRNASLFGWFDALLIVFGVLYGVIHLAATISYLLDGSLSFTPRPSAAFDYWFISVVGIYAVYWYFRRRGWFAPRNKELHQRYFTSLDVWLLITCVYFAIESYHIQRGALRFISFHEIQPKAATLFAYSLFAAIWFIRRRGWGSMFASQGRQKEAGSQLIQADPPAICFSIKRTRPSKWDAVTAASLIETILEQSDKVAIDFSVEADAKNIQFVVFLHFGVITLETMRGLVKAFYPDAVVEIYEPSTVMSFPLYRRYKIYKRTQDLPFFESFRSGADIRQNDPLASLAQALEVLDDDERVSLNIRYVAGTTFQPETIQYLMTMSKMEAGQRSPRYYRAKDFWSGLGEDFARALSDSLTRVPRYSGPDERRYRAKFGRNIYQVTMSLLVESPTPERVGLLTAFDAIVKSFNAFEHPLIEDGITQDCIVAEYENYLDNHPDRLITEWMSQSVDGKVTDELDTYSFYVTADELAALWHLPHEGVVSTKLDLSMTYPVAMPRALQSDTQGIQIGVNRHNGKEQGVRLPLNERTAHTAIIGKTGRGKSSLLHHMVHQDIAAGRGVCVIDPKGALVADILRYSIPAEREDDLIVLDVSTLVGNVFYPPPLNLFVSGIDADQQSETAQRLVSLFSLTDRDFAEKRMGTTLRQALMAVQAQTNPTINDVYCLLFDDDYRFRLLPHIQHDIVANFWRKFDMKKANEQANISQPLEWRIERFMLNSRLRAMTCHPLRLNIGKLMGANKIILVSLGDESGTLPQDDLHLLGAALLMQLEYAARRKVVTRPPFMIYLDEAQEFVNTNLPAMLSQLRSYGVGLVLANQYFDQLFGKTFKAVEGNISTLIAFEVGIDDARSLLPYLEPNFTDNALVALGKYTAALSMLDADGKRHPAFTLETLPPPGYGQTQFEREAYLRRRVIERWQFKPYDEVLTSIQQRYADCGASAVPPKPTKPITSSGTSGANLEFFE